MSALRLSAAARSALAGCLPAAGRLPAAGAAPVLAPALVLAPAAALAPAAQEERRVGRGLVEALLGDAVWWKRTTPKKRTSHSRSRIKSAQWRRLEPVKAASQCQYCGRISLPHQVCPPECSKESRAIAARRGQQGEPAGEA